MNVKDIYRFTHKSVEERYLILNEIKNILLRINEKDYPNIHALLQNDEKRISLIQIMLINRFSELAGTTDYNKIVDSLEVTL